MNSDGEVLQSSGRTGKYLELAPGTPDHNVLSLARAGLRIELRAALHVATSQGRVAVKRNIVVGTNGGAQTIDLFVQPMRQLATTEPLYMIVFQDVGGIEPVSDTNPVQLIEDSQAGSLRQLEQELRATRERLQMTTEELESSNEELKSGNEELSSMNEELQSANEELETSKEELQSLNEELQTVNAELSTRVEDLSRASSDMANLLQSTQIATVFLDADLAVKSFTPAAKDLFHLVESDAGRPIGHVRARFRLDTLSEDVARVLRTLTTIERNVESTDSDARYIMRIMPYRTVENVISGVVITFGDVTRVTAAEARVGQLASDLRRQVRSLETLLDLVPFGILFVEPSDGIQIKANRAGARLVGQVDASSGLRALTVPWQLLQDGHPMPEASNPLYRALHTGEAAADNEVGLARADGSLVHVMISAMPLLDEGGAVRGAIAALVDMSEHKAAEERNQVLLHELQHRVKNTLATVSAIATRTLKPKGGHGDTPLSEVVDGFLSRLRALSGMHDLLAGQSWTGADIRDLLLSALQPYRRADGADVRLEGGPLLLRPKAAGVLGMVFHELATNAAKYGSLSSTSGSVLVRWSVDGSSPARVVVDWSEHDGPQVRASPQEGFGTTFIRRSVEYELGGSVDLRFPPTGTHCIVTVPVEQNAT